MLGLGLWLAAWHSGSAAAPCLGCFTLCRVFGSSPALCSRGIVHGCPQGLWVLLVCPIQTHLGGLPAQPIPLAAQPGVLSWVSASPPRLPTLQWRWDPWKLCTWHPLPGSLWHFAAAHAYFVKMCAVNQVYVGWCWENSVWVQNGLLGTKPFCGNLPHFHGVPQWATNGLLAGSFL